MKAIQIKRTGGPEVLEYVDVPTPVASASQVLVRAHTIGVNMPEVLVRRGLYRWSPPFPAIPGIEMSGIVEAVGADVRAFRVGQPVYVSARELTQRGGCYAEYIAVDQQGLYALPEGVDLESVAALSGYQVAWHLLNNATRGFRFDSVLVTAAGGGIGSACVQLARAAGKRVIAVAGSDEKVAFARSQGAESAINYRTEDVTARVKELTQGRGVDLLLDSVGGKEFSRLFDCLDILGMLVLYGHLGGWPDAAGVFNAMEGQMGRSVALRLFSMHAFDHDPRARHECTAALLDLLGRGAIKPVIHERLPLADAARAQAMLESGAVIGKVVLKP
jgi:NADPH2:quinone reductase